mgnify:CR=1 FL=1
MPTVIRDLCGCPRYMLKVFNEVWMVTSVGSMKVNDFKANNKAGLCYDYYGDGVALRGTVEIITDNTIRKDIWSGLVHSSFSRWTK